MSASAADEAEAATNPVYSSAPLPRQHRRGVWLLLSATAVAYSALSLSYHRRLLTTAYDLGIFFQALRGWAHFHAPTAPIKGVHDHLGANFNLLGDHFHPIIAVLTPTYWLWPHPQILLIDQALLFAVAVWPIWLFAFRLHGPGPAYLLSSAYVLFWGLQTAAIFDFHEYAFAVPLIAFSIERLQAKRWRQAGACILALLLVKEDMGFVVAAFGVYLAIRGHRRAGAALVATGLVAYAVVTRVAMPHLGGHVYLYWYYGELGPNLPAALGFLLTHPVRSVHILLTPHAKVKLLEYLTLPFLLLPLLSPLLVLAIPLLAERLFSDHPNNWSMHFHYNAPLAPIVVMATADGLARARARLTPQASLRVTWGATAAVAVAAILVTAFMPLRQLVNPATWRTSATVAAGYAALAQIPDGARVEATNRLVPQLVDRTSVVLLDGQDHEVDWSLVWVTRKEWPFDTVEAQQLFVASRRAAGWLTVVDNGDFILLRRG